MAYNIPTSSIARPSKITHIGISGLKICHLATLGSSQFNVTLEAVIY
jgi:hypothetical protein